MEKESLPKTGISGLYEVMIGVKNAKSAIRYFQEFGFRTVAKVKLSKKAAHQLYRVPSALTAYRMQNGTIDSHGLLRILEWKEPLGPGLGYVPPDTIGQRMSVMLTKDLFRLVDTYNAARESGEKWLATEPIADDLFGLDDQKKDFFNRPVIVRESGVYGDLFNHVFFQRYGYNIPGYGTIGEHSPLKTSEFTHHDFAIKGNIHDLDYLQTALGLRSEEPPALNGDWQKGPKRVFQFQPGESHWFWGFVSPNNICGKLKFFVPQSHKLDLSERQRVGELGITLHSFYTPKLKMIYNLVTKDERLTVGDILENEFGEACFIFSDTVGCTWQIIEKKKTNHKPVKVLKFELVNE